MEQLELFTQDKEYEHIKEKSYVYIKNQLDNIIWFESLIPGYVTKIENIENERVCHVFFGNRIIKYYDHQLTKNNTNK